MFLKAIAFAVFWNYEEKINVALLCLGRLLPLEDKCGNFVYWQTQPCLVFQCPAQQSMQFTLIPKAPPSETLWLLVVLVFLKWWLNIQCWPIRFQKASQQSRTFTEFRSPQWKTSTALLCFRRLSREKYCICYVCETSTLENISIDTYCDLGGYAKQTIKFIYVSNGLTKHIQVLASKVSSLLWLCMLWAKYHVC